MQTILFQPRLVLLPATWRRRTTAPWRHRRAQRRAPRPHRSAWSQISPKVPSDDATPTPPEVQQLIKKVAANVITTLHTFFKDHTDVLTGLGISVADMPTHLYQCDALPLPTADSALDHTVSQLRPKVACAW